MRRGTNITRRGLATLDMSMQEPSKKARRLTDKQRADIRRYHEAGWSDNAIAIHMKIANQTVYTELSRITGIVGRCRECGGKVFLPCRECELKKRKKEGTLQDG